MSTWPGSELHSAVVLRIAAAGISSDGPMRYRALFSRLWASPSTVLHRNALWSATADGQHDDWRTRNARFGGDDSPGWHQSGIVPIPGFRGHQHGLNVLAFADINVSAFVEIAGQHLLTLSRRISREGNITLTFEVVG